MCCVGQISIREFTEEGFDQVEAPPKDRVGFTDLTLL
jgi:hypothetical protein